MTCAQAQELLAAYADRGLEGREHDIVTGHVAGCKACADEVTELRALLAGVRRVPDERDRPDMPEPFWQDFTRDVRVAVVNARPPAWRRWWPALFAAAAAALLLATLLVKRPPAPPVAHRARPLPASFDVEDLSDKQLSAAVAAFDEPEDDQPASDEELAASNGSAADEAIEDLDEEALARVSASL